MHKQQTNNTTMQHNTPNPTHTTHTHTHTTHVKEVSVMSSGAAFVPVSSLQTVITGVAGHEQLEHNGSDRSSQGVPEAHIMSSFAPSAHKHTHTPTHHHHSKSQ